MSEREFYGGFDNYGTAGSGSEDLGPAGSPTKHKDTGEPGGAPDSGALEAFGGISHSRTIHRAQISQSVSIDRDGYPMNGEPASQDRGRGSGRD